MKKYILTALILSLLLYLCACNSTLSEIKPNGTYADDLGFSEFTFSGNSVTSVYLGDPMKTGLKMDESTRQTGRFEMDGAMVNIQFDNGSKDTFTYDKETDTLDYLGVLTYRKKGAQWTEESKESAYKAAIAALEDGRFLQARLAFNKLDDYKDSADIAKKLENVRNYDILGRWVFEYVLSSNKDNVGESMVIVLKWDGTASISNNGEVETGIYLYMETLDDGSDGYLFVSNDGDAKGYTFIVMDPLADTRVIIMQYHDTFVSFRHE